MPQARAVVRHGVVPARDVCHEAGVAVVASVESEQPKEVGTNAVTRDRSPQCPGDSGRVVAKDGKIPVLGEMWDK